MVRNTKRIYAVGAMCLLALSNAGSAHAAQLRGPAGGGRGLAAAVQDKGMDEALDAACFRDGRYFLIESRNGFKFVAPGRFLTGIVQQYCIVEDFSSFL